MTGVFRSNNPFNYLLLFFFSLLLNIEVITNPASPVISRMDGILYSGIFGNGGLIPANLYGGLLFILFFMQAVYLNELSNRFKLFPANNYLPAMAYLLMTSQFIQLDRISAPVLANSFIIAAFFGIIRLHTPSGFRPVIFNIGLFLGLAALFFFPSAIMIILALAALVIYRPFILQEWVLFLLGLLTPYYFVFSWFFLTDNMKLIQLQKLQPDLKRWMFSNTEFISISIILISFIAGLYFLRANFRKFTVQVRKSWVLIFLFILLSLVIPFLSSIRSVDQWLPLMLGCSLISACTFCYPRRDWFPQLMHWAMVVMAIYVSYFI